VKEGLQKANYMQVMGRARDTWLEEIKYDIWNRAKKLTYLQKTAGITTTKGISKYSLPTDFSSILSIAFLSGEVTGTAQAGSTSTTVKLAADDTSTDSIIGRKIAITGGTGVGQIRQAYAINTTTKVVSIDPAWDTTPDDTSTYMIITKEWGGTSRDLWRYDDTTTPTQLGKPYAYAIKGDSDDGEILLYPNPDATYVLQVRYYCDLTELDLTSTSMSTIYKRWRKVFVQGIYARALQDLNNKAWPMAQRDYEREMALTVSREIYGADESNLQITIYERD
jgi:hypothetical protein